MRCQLLPLDDPGIGRWISRASRLMGTGLAAALLLVVSPCLAERVVVGSGGDDLGVRVLEGRKVHPGVRFYIAAASWEVYREAVEKGLMGALIDAGVMIGYPSCGLCTGFQGVLAKGEKCIAATPRNFRGRMGSPHSEIYLASPTTVTASAIAGKIVDPREIE